jgi:hypothetical protein
MHKEQSLRLERQNPYDERKLPASLAMLEETIQAMATERDAILSISDADKETDEGLEEGPPALLIGASGGSYTATALLGEDDFFDLIGNPAAIGMVTLMLGGQERPYPKKYLVTMEQALKIALGYFERGAISLDLNEWDSQQSPSNAWDQNE